MSNNDRHGRSENMWTPDPLSDYNGPTTVGKSSNPRAYVITRPAYKNGSDYYYVGGVVDLDNAWSPDRYLALRFSRKEDAANQHKRLMAHIHATFLELTF